MAENVRSEVRVAEAKDTGYCSFSRSKIFFQTTSTMITRSNAGGVCFLPVHCHRVPHSLAPTVVRHVYALFMNSLHQLWLN